MTSTGRFCGLIALAVALAACGGDDPAPVNNGPGGSGGTGGDGGTGGVGGIEEPECGDGVREGDEGCDDGTGNSDTEPDACRTDCTPARCGDDVIDTGETCDDGNATPDDGCSALCILENCGNGALDGDEECDDGNAVSGDGCSASCTDEGTPGCGDGILQAGEDCDDGNELDTDACVACAAAACGDGALWAEEEECDDGNTAAGDGCGADCAFEGFCGDGLTNPLREECDDGNTADDDACLADCTPAACGDGIVWTGEEECDDGENNSDTLPDACRTTCEAAACGDAVVDSDEDCEDGNSDVTDACVACQDARCGDGFIQAGAEACDDGAGNSDTVANACRTSCEMPACGDGVIDANETCDAGPDNSDTVADACRTSCAPAGCGDGVVDTGEACDAGANNSDTVADACRTTCAPAGCGDGVVDYGETCDAGAANSDTVADACRTACVPAGCGDGVVDAGETCDAGANNSDAVANACRTACVPAGCGDGVTDAGETCDAGPANSDTVVDACRTTCTAAGCGDGVTDTGEECDDGNTAPGDGCDATCAIENPCGNGVIDPGELCDDGARVAGDGCSETCQPELGWTCTDGVCTTICGDGLVRGTEPCDDLDPSPADGCTADCRIAGDTCAEAVSLNLVDADADPNVWSWSSTTVGRTADFDGDDLPGTCPDTSGKRDAVATFTVPVDGTYFIEQTSPSYWDSVLYATLTCGGVDGVGCGDSPSFTVAELTAGTTLYLVVDGYGGTVSDSNTGAFTLTVKRRHCGDGHVAPGEQCDAGPANSDTAPDACRTDCTLDRCGDGVTDSGETCDDGNTVGGDGCTRNCILEGGCGDELLQAGEACDDGNLAAGDGCSATCAVESGWECPGNVCATICGDGVVTAPETCEDGNAVDWDGCTGCRRDGDGCDLPMPLDVVDTNADPNVWTWSGSTATMTSDYNSSPFCSSSGGKRDAVAVFTAPAPGDYFIDMNVTWDGVVYAYTGTCGGATAVDCSDYPEEIEAVLDTGETIWIVLDGYGNTVSDANSGAFTLTVTRRYCGDGTVRAPELCDAGAGNSDTAPDACRTDCTPAGCGDGVTDSSETCDDGNATDGDGCSAACTLEAGCGNGVVEGAEACDDANGATGDGCTALCEVEAGWACPGNVCAPICGDGQLVGGEACDDGNATDWDGCTACQLDGDTCTSAVPLDLVDTDADPHVWTWSASTAAMGGDFAAGCASTQGRRDAVTAFTAPAAGTYHVESTASFDRVLFARETACADGTQLACTDSSPEQFDLVLDAAETVWIVLDGYGSTVSDANSGPFVLTVRERYCGDGLVTAPEACDAGAANSDTAPNTCRLDCTPARCGDAVVDGGERCDDGNTADGDACSANCLFAGLCGNGALDAGEGCDDGNTMTGDGCALTCTAELGWDCVANTCLPDCGDGIAVGPEGCDDGNAVDGDGCSATCQCDPATTHTFAATIATPIPVPDNSTTGAATSLTVAGVTGLVTDLDVNVEVPHEYGGDVEIFLTGPGGLRIPLARDMFGGGENVYDGTTFDDDANPALYAVRVSSTSTSTSGVKTPLQPERSLGLFHGTDPNGTWTLEVLDDGTGDLGTIDAFSITLRTNASVVPRPALVFASEQTQPIPDNSTSAPLLSTIVVPDGAYGDIFDVRVRVNLRHPSSDQLDVALIAPNGEVYELTTDNGSTYDNVFDGTVFLESATAPLANAGSYSNNVVRPEAVPESSLSKLVGAPMPGTWTLRVADDASSTTGALEGWSLTLVSVSCDLPR